MDLDRYKETAEMPFLPERQVRMLRFLHSEECCLDDLAAEIYRMAAEDRDRLVGTQPAEDDPTVLTCLERMIDDHNQDHHAIELLRTVARPVLEAIIDGTIGHRYVTDAKFKTLTAEFDSCGGAYLNTFVLRGNVDRRDGLNTNEWAKLQDMERRYIAGNECRLTPQSTQQERDDADEAAEIDKAYLKQKELIENLKRSARDGMRALYNPKGMPKFCDEMSKRQRPDLDPTGTIQQRQMPIEVRYAENLFNQSVNYDLRSGLRGTPTTWQLTLSCLAVMGIQMEVVSIPILKIWKPDQLQITEILLTILAGSLVEWGGMNLTAPGGKQASQQDYNQYKKQIVCQPWAIANMNESLEKAARRVEIFEDANAMADGTMLAKMQGIMKRIEEADASVKAVIAREGEWDEVTKQLDTNIEQLDKNIAQYEEWEGSQKEVDTFFAQNLP